MSQDHTPTQYRIFLLTVWRERKEGENSSQDLFYRLEDPRTGERRGFSNPEAVVAFLQVCMSGLDVDQVDDEVGQDM